MKKKKVRRGISKAEWLEAGLQSLSEEGVAGVAVEKLAMEIMDLQCRGDLKAAKKLLEEMGRPSPALQAVERRIEEAIQQVHRPPGYTIETPDPDASFSWFKKILVPVVLLLFALLGTETPQVGSEIGPLAASAAISSAPLPRTPIR